MNPPAKHYKNRVSPSEPHLTSYDSGYEFSLEHLLDLRRLVEDTEEQEEKQNEAVA